MNRTNHESAARRRRKSVDNTPMAERPEDERWLMRIAGAIREQRLLADLTIFELAALSGLHSLTIARFERGDAWPSMRAVVRIALALRITLQELMP